MVRVSTPSSDATPAMPQETSQVVPRWRAPSLESTPTDTKVRRRQFAPRTAVPMGQSPAKAEGRQPSSQPVAAPVFDAVGWDAEVDELVMKMASTTNSDRAVQQVVHFVKKSLMPLVPEAEVLGCVSSDFSCGAACRVAVPEVEIVVRVDPRILHTQFCSRRSPNEMPDARRAQKLATRACMDRLVATGHFKFRRSAFRGLEPRVTLLVATSLGIHDEPIPIDLSLNSTSPVRNAALLAECERIEPRAKALSLLVKRWAKDRGVCHDAKGHLSPYAWTLLTIYFLQVGVPDGQILPPLHEFQLGAGLDGEKKNDVEKSVAALFKDFTRFYCEKFDFRNEAVCVRKGVRAPADVTLPLHVVLEEGGSTAIVALSIEDPFDPKRNLSSATTASSLARMKEELVRANSLCASGASLSELLQPWAPPDCLANGEMPGEDEERD